MNVLLLGNGFDLYYKFPTKYNNFLHTTAYLINNYSEEVKTIGDVFSDEKLRGKDSFIDKCYNSNKTLFDNTILPKEEIKELINISKDNIWFNYLLKSFNKDVGWIDFEREISTVIYSFQTFLKNIEIEFYNNSFPKSSVEHYIIKTFNFFYLKQREGGVSEKGVPINAIYKIKDEYIVEYPLGSGIKKVNVEKVVKTLSNELSKLAKALKLYLKCFVEKALDEKESTEYLEKHKMFLHNDYVITLNYTNTFEKIYSDGEVFHLHGNVNDEIVLGVNPDFSDEKENIDTSFISFKKYYQRTMLDTDLSYLKWLKERYDDVGDDVHVLVMGHSLDVTDEDIIKDLFGLASKITVLYHNADAKASHIANLVRIYGKAEFDKLREEQELSFLPMDMDFSEFEKRQLGNSFNNYLKQINSILR